MTILDQVHFFQTNCCAVSFSPQLTASYNASLYYIQRPLHSLTLCEKNESSILAANNKERKNQKLIPSYTFSLRFVACTPSLLHSVLSIDDCTLDWNHTRKSGELLFRSNVDDQEHEEEDIGYCGTNYQNSDGENQMTGRKYHTTHESVKDLVVSTRFQIQLEAGAHRLVCFVLCLDH